MGMDLNVKELAKSVLEEADENQKKETKAHNRSVIFIIAGAYCLLMDAIFFMGFSSGHFSMPMLFIGVGLILIGAASIVRGLQWKAIDALLKKYLLLITNHPEYGVHDLAASLKTTPDVVKDTFRLFHKRGLMTDIAVDEQTNKLVYGAGLAFELGENASSRSASDEMIEVECQSCGARKMISIGEMSTCEHCGSEIHG